MARYCRYWLGRTGRGFGGEVCTVSEVGWTGKEVKSSVGSLEGNLNIGRGGDEDEVSWI